MMFWLMFMFIAAQRLAEVRLAKSNERWMKERGAREYGSSHYPIMVLIHTGFFLSLAAEVVFFQKTVSPYWPVLLFVFAAAQAARIWVIRSLGKFWNTKIIVLPGAQVVAKGPFQYIKHPNYLVVTVELLVIPLLFQAYITAAAFFVFNQAILAVRIPAEERALKEYTDYTDTFGNGKNLTE
ncbi:MAG TPA: isoprenylcysteine carboxylmethyltransferase family protein [Bacillaceae bacterium]